MHRNDVHHASPGRPTCLRPLALTSTSLPLLCHNYDGTQIATPTKYARQLLCHSIRLRRTPHSPSSPRGASLPLWLYKLSPCAGCASHANQISVGLIKNRSRDLQASLYCAQLSSAPTSPAKVTTNCSRTRLLCVQNLILSSLVAGMFGCCMLSDAVARQQLLRVCVCWGGCARVGSKPL